ncbi:asparaginase [Telmatospirillum sp. J64-1]|uniref:asparaginase n=1 Tax=Telmatospirillum sp. J64-1 TaxID=2502183 RepID=UPI00115D6DFB|nr:asparaginase [Telmatospirillum sp. J64-1]
MGEAANPILVEIIRGGQVESYHRGVVCVSNAKGEVALSLGDISRPAYPRSAVKPLQALPLVETGALDHWHLGPRELALACASHTGEARHTEAVAAWLERIGLGPKDLECGSHAPVDPDTARRLVHDGIPPCPLHNNCSGKHAGMLTTARFMGEETRGYILPDHPVQRRVTEALAEMTETPLDNPAVDGCGIPTFALPLSALALGMARLADPGGQSPGRRAALERIRAAMTAHPEMVGGSVRMDTRLMQPGRPLVTKGGAEAVYAAALPAQGLGIAVKIDDGASRASDVAMIEILRRLGALSPDDEARLAGHARPALRNAAGRVVGEIRPGKGWA